MLLPVHKHTLRVIIRIYGSHHIHLDSASPLLPLLTSQPTLMRGHLGDHIEISGHRDLVSAVHPDAGHNLYRAHMHQLMDWITLHVSMEQPAWTAMMDYYRVMDLQVDDLDPASVYRQWYRKQAQKNAKNYLYNQVDHVAKNISPQKSPLKDVMTTAAGLIQRFPEAFYTRSGRPDAYMIKKCIMHAMAAHHGWPQVDIASCFGMTQPAVSQHLRPFFLTQSPVLS